MTVTSSTPAMVRNALIGSEVYQTAMGGGQVGLVLNPITCEQNPCIATSRSDLDLGAEVESISGSRGVVQVDGGICRNGDMGVYCGCYKSASVLSTKEVCLDDTSNVTLEANDPQLIQQGTGSGFETFLNLTAGQSHGNVLWEVEVVNEEDMEWLVSPSVGLLPPGGMVKVYVKGKLELGNINTFTSTAFKATAIQSGKTSIASINATFYFCKTGLYYDDRFNAVNGTCELCSELPLSEGLECGAPGYRISTLPLAPGYWRANKATTVLRECLHEKACVGGSVVQDANGYCAEGYMGPYCAVCREGYAPGVGMGCHQCSAAFKATVVVFLALGGIITVALLLWIVRKLVRGPEDSDAHSSLTVTGRVKRLLKHVPLHKLKIPIVVYQILTQFSDISSAEYPRVYQHFLTLLDGVNLDIGWIFSASCVFDVGFYEKLVATTVTPLILFLGLLCTYMFATRRLQPRLSFKRRGPMSTSRSLSLVEHRQRESIWARHMSIFLLLTFLVYSTTSTVIFQTFACDEISELKESYLRADYRLPCHSPEHDMYKIYAGFMVLVYPVGIPTLYFLMLYKNRHRVFPKQALADGVPPARRLADKKIAHTRFLWQAYRPEVYYYEVIECVRRLALTGCLVFIFPNSAAQAAVACVLSMVTICLTTVLRPFQDLTDFKAYVLGAIIIFLSMFMALTAKVRVTDEDTQSQVILAWMLILLNLALTILTIIECIFEVRSLCREHPLRVPLDEKCGQPGMGLHGKRGVKDKPFLKGSSGEEPTDERSSEDFYEHINTLHKGGSDSKLVTNIDGRGRAEGTDDIAIHIRSEPVGRFPYPSGYAEPMPDFQGEETLDRHRRDRNGNMNIRQQGLAGTAVAGNLDSGCHGSDQALSISPKYPSGYAEPILEPEEPQWGTEQLQHLQPWCPG
ncbi:unnamed protein product [Discosporangium mesarthrocarpum]